MSNTPIDAFIILAGATEPFRCAPCRALAAEVEASVAGSRVWQYAELAFRLACPYAE